MGKVSGRDGITVQIRSDDGITADQLAWTLDRGATDGAGDSLEHSFRVGKAGIADDGFSLTPIGPAGAAPTGPLDIRLSADAYTNDQDRTGLGLDLGWERARVRLDSLSVSDDSRSFGTVVLDTSGRFRLLSDGGLFNRDGDHASLMLNIGDVDASSPDPTNWSVNAPGQLYYRMGGAGGTEARLDRLGFLLDMQRGTVGVDSQGLLVRSAPGSRTDFNLTFDLVANANSSFESDPAIDLPMLFFGWRGGLEDFEFRMTPGGTWLPDGTVTQGITSSLGFNLANDFQVVIGEAGDDRSYLEFTDPQSLPSTLSPGRRDVNFGALALDAVSASQGVGPICWGATNTSGPLPGCSAQSFDTLPFQLIDLPPTDSGMALIARDWGLHAYPSRVSYRDGIDSALDVDDKGWALIYTLGELSSNIYLYPQVGGGITMDAVTAIQTIGTTDVERWENGTHFMIGDTDKNMAIGLVGADMLFAAREMDIGLSLAAGGLRFYSDQGVRFQLRGMFGGGDIPDMSSQVYESYFDMNLEFDEFAFNVLPDILGEEYLAFGGFFSFADLDNGFSNDAGGAHGHDDGSYFSLSEPNFDLLGVDFRLADITGDIEIPITYNQGGKIDLISASSAVDDEPRLLIESKMRIGMSATTPGGAQGDPLKINRVEMGGTNLGSIVIPSGRVHSRLMLKQQQ